MRSGGEARSGGEPRHVSAVASVVGEVRATLVEEAAMFNVANAALRVAAAAAIWTEALESAVALG